MLGNFSCLCCRLLTVYKSNLFQKNLLGTLSDCLKIFDLDQEQGSVGLDLLFTKVITDTKSHC